MNLEILAQAWDNVIAGCTVDKIGCSFDSSMFLALTKEIYRLTPKVKSSPLTAEEYFANLKDEKGE